MTISAPACDHWRYTIGRMADPEYIDAADAARILRVSVQTVRRETRAGRLPAIKIGRGYRYNIEDLRRLSETPNRQDRG